MAWSQCNNHHSVQCEVDEAHQYVVVEPQDFLDFPLKPDHGVQEKTVHKCLNYNVDCLYGHLQNLLIGHSVSFVTYFRYFGHTSE